MNFITAIKWKTLFYACIHVYVYNISWQTISQILIISFGIASKEVYENWEFQGGKLMKGIQNEEIVASDVKS